MVFHGHRLVAAPAVAVGAGRRPGLVQALTGTTVKALAGATL